MSVESKIRLFRLFRQTSSLDSNATETQGNRSALCAVRDRASPSRCASSRGRRSSGTCGELSRTVCAMVCANNSSRRRNTNRIGREMWRATWQFSVNRVLIDVPAGRSRILRGSRVAGPAAFVGRARCSKLAHTCTQPDAIPEYCSPHQYARDGRGARDDVSTDNAITHRTSFLVFDRGSVPSRADHGDLVTVWVSRSFFLRNTTVNFCVHMTARKLPRPLAREGTSLAA